MIYTGRIARGPFTEWTATEQGRAVVDAVASRIRFSLIGKARAARRRLWRQLASAARDEAIITAIQHQADAYLRRLGELASANTLPCVGMELHRLFVVPRVLANGAAYDAIERSLIAEPRFASLEGGDPLREFFILRLIHEIESSVAKAQPSPRRPLAVGSEWGAVGLNPCFVWRVPVLQDPPWQGHYYVLELTRTPITRSVRKATHSCVERLEASLPALSRVERNEILRRATRHEGSLTSRSAQAVTCSSVG